MGFLKSFTHFLLSSCILFGTSNSSIIDTADTQKDYANFSHFCVEKYINTLLTDGANINHISIIGSEMLNINPESLNLIYGHRDDSYWTVTSLNNMAHLQHFPKCTHIVWITPEIQQLDLKILQKINSGHLVAIHIIVQQPNSLIESSQKLQHLQNNIRAEIFIVSQIQSGKSSSQCQVITAKMHTLRKHETVEVNAFSSELQKRNFQVVPVFVREQKRTLNVLAREYRPFYFKDKTEGVWKGIDHFLLQTIAQELHLDINMCVMGEDEYLKQFNLKTFDLIIGGMARYLVNKSTFVSLTSYHQDAYTWCVARARAIPYWKNGFYIITDNIVFVLFTIGVVIVNVLVFFLTAFDPTPLDVWRGLFCFLRVILGMSIDYKPLNFRLRILFAIAMIVCIWIIAIFVAYFLKFYSFPIYEEQVKSVTEIVERNYKLLASRVNIDEIIQKLIIPSDAFYLLEECLDIDACLRQTASSNNFAVAVSRQYAQSIIPNTQFFCFDRSENLFSDLVSFWIRKDFYMTHDINVLIERVTEGGFVSKWVKDHKTIWPEVNRKFVAILSVNNLLGAWLVVGPFMLLSIVVAILEQVIYRMAKAPSAHRFWILASKFIDDERYLFPRKWIEDTE